MTKRQVEKISPESADVDRLLADLARAHRTPKSVEQFGIEVVPRVLRTANWTDLFFLWFTTVLNPVFFMFPGMAIVNGGLSYWQAVIVQGLGGFIALSAVSVLGMFGPDYGLPGQMLVRSILGINGTRFGISFLRMLSNCYWFGFQTLAAALGIQAVLAVLVHQTYDILAISVILALAQTVLALFGFNMMKKAGKALLPVMVFVALTMLYLLVFSGDPAYLPENVLWHPPKSAGWWSFLLWLSISAGSWAQVAISGADFTRYGRGRMDMWIGTAFGGGLGLTAAALVGAYGAGASGDWNLFAVTARIAGSGAPLYILLIGLVISVLCANTMNLYSGGLSVVNIVSRIGRFWATIVASVFAVSLSLLPTLINDAQGWMSELGHAFTPIDGVLLADYLLLKRTHIDVTALVQPNGRYRYWRGVNWIAVACIVAGYFLFSLLPDWTMPAIATVILTGAMYLVAAWVASKCSIAYRLACKPAEAEEPEE